MGEKNIIFINAFASTFARKRIDCQCGLIHYDNAGQYDWSDGEIERLQANTKAMAHDGVFVVVEVDNGVVVPGCKCEEGSRRQVYFDAWQ